MAAQQAGVEAGVLGQVDPPAGVGHEAVEAVEHRAQPRLGRDVDGERPARRRERQRPGVAGAEALEHGHERRRTPASRRRSSTLGQTCGRRRRARRTATARSRAGRTTGSSRRTMSSGWKNVAIVCTSPVRCDGAVRYRRPLKAAIEHAVARGRHGRRRQGSGASCASGSPSTAPRRAARARLRASTPRPSGAAAGAAVEPRHRVAGRVDVDHGVQHLVEVGQASVSTTMRLVSIGMARNVHDVTTPVRPMPPGRRPERVGVAVAGRRHGAHLTAGQGEVDGASRDPSTTRRRRGSCRGRRRRPRPRR